MEITLDNSLPAVVAFVKSKDAGMKDVAVAGRKTAHESKRRKN